MKWAFTYKNFGTGYFCFSSKRCGNAFPRILTPLHPWSYRVSLADRTGFTNRLCTLRSKAEDTRGPPTNCLEHRVNCRYMIVSINIRQKCMPFSFMKFSFIQQIRFRGNNAKVFQRGSMNLNITVG